jgi:hypothetical protein
MAVSLSALRAGHPLTPRKIPGTHFCQRLSRLQCHSSAGMIRSVEKIHLIWNGTGDLPACIIVPNTLPRAPLAIGLLVTWFTWESSMYMQVTLETKDSHLPTFGPQYFNNLDKTKL